MNAFTRWATTFETQEAQDERRRLEARARLKAQRASKTEPRPRRWYGGWGEVAWSSCCLLLGALLAQIFGPSFLLVAIALILVSRR